MDSFIIDLAGAGAATGTADLVHTPFLVPKSEPVDEFPSQFGFPTKTNPHFLSDTIQSNGDSNAVETPQLHTEVILYDRRSSELVRASSPDAESERQYLELVRTTRIIYGSLLAHLFAYIEVKNQQGRAKKGAYRGDLKAGKYMRENGLWQHRNKRLVGIIPGVQIGDVFLYRIELCMVALHGSVQGGIDFVPSSQRDNGDPIATSIVISGGYEDDEDSGNVIIYTGQGGQCKGTQIAHQKLQGGNLALERSMHHGIEIRVIRGVYYQGSPSGRVYIYDGIYKIVDTAFDVGKSGFGIFKFKLVRMENQPATGSSIFKFAESLKRHMLPNRYISVDISHEQENQQVHLFNDVDDDQEPTLHSYIPKAILPAIHNSKQRGCPCASDCSYYCPCSMKNGCVYVYDKWGNLVRGKQMIFECGPSCGCPPSCRNRRTHRGLNQTFEVFRTIDKRWGVRCLDLILPGAFVCEFAGVGLTMNLASVVTMNGVDNLIYSNQFGESWREWGDYVSNVTPKYAQPAYPSIPISEFAVDVSRVRNFACYIRHSSSAANLFVQRVANDEQSSVFPRLMLFANQNIPPMRELTLDYGIGKRKNQKKLKIEN